MSDVKAMCKFLSTDRDIFIPEDDVKESNVYERDEVDFNELMEKQEFQSILYRIKHDIYMELKKRNPSFTFDQLNELTHKQLNRLFKRTMM